ncbi:MAG: type II secretion system F family protein [Planctomycetes bacterium]|nr:type II secretion system F family protein [Planctomycetota bacterium]
MATFQYEALDETGKPRKDTISANTSEEAVEKIRKQGLFPTSVREQKVKKTKGAVATTTVPGAKRDWKNIQINIGGVSQKVLTTFTRQMSTLQDAGLPILRSVKILEEQQKAGMFKNILGGTHEAVSGGSTLSDAMARYPKAFDKLYTKMIAAGEIGGVLDVILQRLAEFMEKSAKLKKRIIGAMIYPAVVVSVAGLIVTGIMVFIVPKFQKIFDDFNTELPLMTKILINSSKWLGGTLYPDQLIPGLVYIIFCPILFVFGIKMARKTIAGRAIVDAISLKIPVAGMIMRKATIARFTRTLGTLISAGVPILDGINITRETTANYVYVRALQKVHDSVRQGESFAEPLRQSKVCDALVVNMIDVGEETGDLDKMLLKIADNYDEDVDNLVASLVSLLEPIMVVVLGGIVGFIVIALFLPLVKLIQTMS